MSFIASTCYLTNESGNSLNNLGELPWDILLSGQELDPDSRQLIRKEIIRRCPEFETNLDADQGNLIHLASEYGYVQIVKDLLFICSTNGEMRPCLHVDKYEKSPLDYAAMKGNMEVIQLLLGTLSLLPTTSGVFVQEQLVTALDIAIREDHCQVFRALAIQYMKNWDIKKMAIIKATNKLLMETPRLSNDVPIEVWETLNKLLLSTIHDQCRDKYERLEKFLASDPLLFKILLSLCSPLQTQFYFCVLFRQTDDLLDEINKRTYRFEPAEGQYKYPMHNVSLWGFIHIVKLILIYESGSSNVRLLKNMDGNTPLHCAARSGQVCIINILLSTCWECAGMVSDKKNETALHCALRNKGAKAVKILLEWYIIKEEFLNNNAQDWQCGDNALDPLVDGYVKIVKELLGQSESKVCFQREFWEGKEYFVVIKCKKNESMGTSFKYQDYIREVTSKTTNWTILSLSVDSRSIITLKVLIRSAMVQRILDVRDVDGNTVFDLLCYTGEVRKTNFMGFVHYERFENVIWLLDAIQMGDYEIFSKLQVEDPHILDYVSALPLGGTPLHIAVRVGQINNCTREIMRKRPEFAATKDHKARNPLHLASAKGYLDIVKELLTQFGFNQCFAGDYTNRMREVGAFYGTPLEHAIEKGRISVINELLAIWWKCVGLASREWSSVLLRTAVNNKQYEALKMLMGRYIVDELLRAKVVDGNPMSALADGYIEIVLKHLLNPKVNYSLSILEKNRVGITGTKPSLPLYFAVIKVASCSRRKDNNIIDELLLSAYYPKYFREVTVGNKMVLHLSKDDEKSVTLKLLLRSSLFYDIDQTGDPIFWITVFQDLCDERKNEVVKNEMGTLIPIWKQLGEGTKTYHECTISEEQSVSAKEVYENVKADHKNDNAEDDNEEQHEQEMLRDTNFSDILDGDNMRNKNRISLCSGQGFASLEDCRNAIKDAAILGRAKVIFTRSTSERIVAKCSNTSCKWIIRAQAKRNSHIYIVTEIENTHTCPHLNDTTNKLATPIWVSSHIIHNVRQDVNISTQQIERIIKSKFQIDIICKTAERAKKRALDIVHELQIVSKKQRRNLTASSSLSLNANQSRSNLRFLEQIPEPVREFIHSTEDVERDGHCGYRVIAMQLGYETMDGWKQVRKELLIEVVQSEELYVKLMDSGTVAKMRKAFAYFADHATDPQYWLSLHNAGYVIANAYKAVVVSLSINSGNLTFLPLLEPPPEGRPLRTITFGFVEGNHFISLNLKPDSPIPQVDRRWDTNVSKAAEVWKTPYLNRFDKFEQIMGFNLGQGSNGRSPIILES